MIIFIVFVTAAVSLACFYNQRLFDSLSLRPFEVVKHGQWWRLITHGFVHGGWAHLLINMWGFWSFATAVLAVFTGQFHAGMAMEANLRFCILYFGGMVFASIYDVIKRHNDPNYASVGASGAVSAVVFTSIFYAPLSKIYMMGILPMPAVVFGVLYIVYEAYSARQQGDNVNHHAHIFGAIYGFLFPVVTGGGDMSYFFRGLGL
jgi:membrane associated rhomboid family serine protease